MKSLIIHLIVMFTLGFATYYTTKYVYKKVSRPVTKPNAAALAKSCTCGESKKAESPKPLVPISPK